MKVASKNLGELSTQAEISHRLSLLGEQDASLWGRMNAAQTVRHLAQAFAMVLQDLPVKSILTPMRGPQGRYLALHSGLRWSKGLMTPPELDMVKQDAKPDNFMREVLCLRGKMRRFCAASEQELNACIPSSAG